jgi:RHS repeat-associated protein
MCQISNIVNRGQMRWCDGLQQVYQRQRGTLTPGTPPYTGITAVQQTEVFSYDETGNWLSDYNNTGGPGGTVLSQSRTHNMANEIVSVAQPPGVIQPLYDPAGNSTTVPQPDNWAAAHTLKWDAWNRLAEVTTAGTTYQYDALFRRIVVKVGTAPYDYYYTDQWQVSEVYDGNTLGWRAFWGLRDLNDLIKRDGVAALGTSLYGLRGKLNFVAVTDNAGAVNLRITYNTFGQARYLTSTFAAGTNAYAWNYLFHGYEWDAQSGFLNVRFRTYHPTLGRWLSRDPIGEEGGLNLYRMVENNPTNAFDELGLRAQFLILPCNQTGPDDCSKANPEAPPMCHYECKCPFPYQPTQRTRLDGCDRFVTITCSLPDPPKKQLHPKEEKKRSNSPSPAPTPPSWEWTPETGGRFVRGLGLAAVAGATIALIAGGPVTAVALLSIGLFGMFSNPRNDQNDNHFL